MTFTQIEYFIIAGRCRTITEAAEKLYVTQQAVSKQIHSLESELGIKLLARSNRGIQLTEAGKICFTAWEKILSIQKDALSLARSVSKEQKSIFRIGINEFEGILNELLPALEVFYSENPDLECQFEVDAVPRLCQKLDTNSIHLLIAFRSELDDFYENISLDFPDIRPGIIISKNHPLSGQQHVELMDLQSERFIFLRSDYSKRYLDNIFDLFKEKKFVPKEVEYVENTNALEVALQLGKGVTIGYNFLFRQDSQQFCFFPLTEQVPDTPLEELVIVWKKQNNAAYARSLAEIYKEVRHH